MSFWKEHSRLRIILMLVGVALILTTLYLYNARFADRKKQ